MKKLAIALILFSLPAFARVNSTDRNLMRKLSQGDSSEVDLARIVEPKASHGDVKAFAQRMVSDHEKSFRKLERIARAEKVSLMGGMDAEHKHFAAKLAHKRLGSPYDRTYIDEMVKDHKKDRQDVRKALREIRNPELKAWAEDELRTVEEHLRLAEDLQNRLR